MPRVPQVDLPSVGLQAGMSPQFQAPQVAPMRDFTGQQIEQAGQGMAQLGAGALRLEDRINDAKASEADAELAEFQLAAWNDYKGTLGKNAIDNKKKYLEDIDKKRQEIASRLDNGFQQDAFARSANYRTLQFKENVERHFEDQSRAYFIGTKEARIKANSSLYGENQDEALFQTILNDVDFIADELQYEPQDPRRAQMKLQAQDNAHLSRLGRLTDGPNKDLAAANQYFQARKDGMSPELRNKIGAQLGKLSMDEDAEAIARNLPAVGPIGAQLQALDDLYDMDPTMSTELLDEARKRAIQADSNRRSARAAFISDTTDELRRAISDGRASGQTVEQILQNNNELRLKVESAGLRTYADEFAADGAQKETTAGDSRFEDIRGNPDQLRNRKWPQIAQELKLIMSERQVEVVYGMWAATNDGVPGMGVSRGKREQEAQALASWDDWIDTTIRQELKLPTDRKLTPDEMDQVKQARVQLDNTLRNAISKDDPEARTKIMDFLREQKSSNQAVLFGGQMVAPWRLTPEQIRQGEVVVTDMGNQVTLPISEFSVDGPTKTAAMAAARVAYDSAVAKYPTDELKDQFRKSPQGQALLAASNGSNNRLLMEVYGKSLIAAGRNNQVLRSEQAVRDKLARNLLNISVNDDELRALVRAADPSGIANPADIADAMHIRGYWNLNASEWEKKEVRMAAVARVQRAQTQKQVVAATSGPFAQLQPAQPAMTPEAAVESIGNRRSDALRQQQLLADFQTYVANTPSAQTLGNEQAVMSFAYSKMPSGRPIVLRTGRPSLDAAATQIINDLTPSAEMILQPYRQAAENVRTQAAMDMADADRKRASEQARQFFTNLPLLTVPKK